MCVMQVDQGNNGRTVLVLFDHFYFLPLLTSEREGKKVSKFHIYQVSYLQKKAAPEFDDLVGDTQVALLTLSTPV